MSGWEKLFHAESMGDERVGQASCYISYNSIHVMGGSTEVNAHLVLSLAGFRGGSTLEKPLYINYNYHLSSALPSRALHSVTTIFHGRLQDQETKAKRAMLVRGKLP